MSIFIKLITSRNVKGTAGRGFTTVPPDKKKDTPYRSRLSFTSYVKFHLSKILNYGYIKRKIYSYYVSLYDYPPHYLGFSDPNRTTTGKPSLYTKLIIDGGLFRGVHYLFFVQWLFFVDYVLYKYVTIIGITSGFSSVGFINFVNNFGFQSVDISIHGMKPMHSFLILFFSLWIFNTFIWLFIYKRYHSAISIFANLKNAFSILMPTTGFYIRSFKNVRLVLLELFVVVVFLSFAYKLFVILGFFLFFPSRQYEKPVVIDFQRYVPRMGEEFTWQFDFRNPRTIYNFISHHVDRIFHFIAYKYIYVSQKSDSEPRGYLRYFVGSKGKPPKFDFWDFYNFIQDFIGLGLKPKKLPAFLDNEWYPFGIKFHTWLKGKNHYYGRNEVPHWLMKLPLVVGKYFLQHTYHSFHWFLNNNLKSYIVLAIQIFKHIFNKGYYPFIFGTGSLFGAFFGWWVILFLFIEHLILFHLFASLFVRFFVWVLHWCVYFTGRIPSHKDQFLNGVEIRSSNFDERGLWTEDAKLDSETYPTWKLHAIRYPLFYSVKIQKGSIAQIKDIKNRVDSIHTRFLKNWYLPKYMPFVKLSFADRRNDTTYVKPPTFEHYIRFTRKNLFSMGYVEAPHRAKILWNFKRARYLRRVLSPYIGVYKAPGFYLFFKTAFFILFLQITRPIRVLIHLSSTTQIGKYSDPLPFTTSVAFYAIRSIKHSVDFFFIARSYLIWVVKDAPFILASYLRSKIRSFFISIFKVLTDPFRSVMYFYFYSLLFRYAGFKSIRVRKYAEFVYYSDSIKKFKAFDVYFKFNKSFIRADRLFFAAKVLLNIKALKDDPILRARFILGGHIRDAIFLLRLLKIAKLISFIFTRPNAIISNINNIFRQFTFYPSVIKKRFYGLFTETYDDLSPKIIENEYHRFTATLYHSNPIISNVSYRRRRFSYRRFLKFLSRSRDTILSFISYIKAFSFKYYVNSATFFIRIRLSKSTDFSSSFISNVFDVMSYPFQKFFMIMDRLFEIVFDFFHRFLPPFISGFIRLTVIVFLALFFVVALNGIYRLNIDYSFIPFGEHSFNWMDGEIPVSTALMALGLLIYPLIVLFLMREIGFRKVMTLEMSDLILLFGVFLSSAFMTLYYTEFVFYGFDIFNMINTSYWKGPSFADYTQMENEIKVMMRRNAVKGVVKLSKVTYESTPYPTDLHTNVPGYSILNHYRTAEMDNRTHFFNHVRSLWLDKVPISSPDFVRMSAVVPSEVPPYFVPQLLQTPIEGDRNVIKPIGNDPHSILDLYSTINIIGKLLPTDSIYNSHVNPVNSIRTFSTQSIEDITIRDKDNIMDWAPELFFPKVGDHYISTIYKYETVDPVLAQLASVDKRFIIEPESDFSRLAPDYDIWYLEILDNPTKYNRYQNIKIATNTPDPMWDGAILRPLISRNDLLVDKLHPMYGWVDSNWQNKIYNSGVTYPHGASTYSDIPGYMSSYFVPDSDDQIYFHFPSAPFMKEVAHKFYVGQESSKRWLGLFYYDKVLNTNPTGRWLEMKDRVFQNLVGEDFHFALHNNPDYFTNIRTVRKDESFTILPTAHSFDYPKLLSLKDNHKPVFDALAKSQLERFYSYRPITLYKDLNYDFQLFTKWCSLEPSFIRAMYFDRRFSKNPVAMAALRESHQFFFHMIWDFEDEYWYIREVPYTGLIPGNIKKN